MEKSLECGSRDWSMKSILCQIYLKNFNFFNSLVGISFSSLNHIYLSYLFGKTSTKSNFNREHPNFLIDTSYGITQNTY